MRALDLRSSKCLLPVAALFAIIYTTLSTCMVPSLPFQVLGIALTPHGIKQTGESFLRASGSKHTGQSSGAPSRRTVR